MSNNVTETDSAFVIGRQTQIVSELFGGITHVQVPNDTKLVSLEKLMPQPARIKADHVFNEVESFAEYFKEFKQDGTRIFVDDERHLFTSVFDCDHPKKPQWGDHRISLGMQYSHEWKRFKQFNGKKMDQKSFSEFICNNINFVIGPITGTELFAMAKSLDIKVKGSIEVDESEAKGLKKLVIKDESVARGRDTNGQMLEFPETLTMKLRVFKNSIEFDVPISLRQRVNPDKTGMIFWIEIKDIETAEEVAFDKCVEALHEVTGIKPLRGSYSSRY